MNKTHLLSVALVAAGFALPAVARQPAIGQLGGVSGNVSIGGKGFVAKATSGTPVVDGQTVMVSTDGRASIHLYNGCTITLEGGQHLLIDANESCAVQQAAVKQMFTPYRLAQAGQGGLAGGGGGGGGFAGLGIAGAITAVGAIEVERTEVSASPN